MARVKQSDLNREQLLNEGVRILSEFGYHGTGLKRVLDAVGIPKGSFYNYYKDKEDFASQVISRYTDEVIETIDRLSRTPGISGVDVLKQYFECFLARSEANDFRDGCLLGNMGAEICDTGVITTLKASVKRVRDRFEECIASAQQSGDLRDDLSAREMADALLNTWEGSLLAMKIEKSSKPVIASYRLLLDDFFHVR